MKNISVLIIIIGIVLTIYTAFTFFTKEKVVDLGNIEISRQEPHHLNWSPILGVTLIAVGGILYWQTSKKT